MVDTEAKLQGEADIVKRFISELALEAKSYGYGTLSDGGSYIYIIAPTNDSSIEKTVSSANNRTYFIVYEHGNNVLRYGEISATQYYSYVNDSGKTDEEIISSMGIKNNPYKLLAEHVTGLKLVGWNPTNPSPLITVQLDLEYNNNKYTTKLNLDGRNVEYKK